MNLGAPELLIVVLVALFIVPTIMGLVRALRNGDGPWVAGIAVGWFFGLGWIVAIVYLLAIDKGRSRDAGRSSGQPPAPGGWHPDPRGRWELRYFDGARWTADVSRDGQTGIDPV